MSLVRFLLSYFLFFLFMSNFLSTTDVSLVINWVLSQHGGFVFQAGGARVRALRCLKDAAPWPDVELHGTVGELRSARAVKPRSGGRC